MAPLQVKRQDSTSDGLLADLAHICQDSGVGADLRPENLPVSEALKQKASKDKLEPHELCIKDSDDYELIFTCLPDNVDKIKSAIAQVSDVPVSEIGKITTAVGRLQWIFSDGTRRSIIPSGWDHFKNKGEKNVKSTAGQEGSGKPEKSSG